ncbi:NAD(P)-binding domain-containing protein [Spongiactinospora sp. TRM90649]|uniref:NADPH-dependent F420 reductase n=1 Tax=Spongiactinospora sp. TRM90649 TaxID=3031114 RepID=UPI0023F7D17F|nr:NAD(P)-binding domain-containing protein [Spongiactinospora sp. TRM90649]MDF5753580.1 NAD(P)-binding domain-containing protein [Spongiactinospora sp. TRM90649]
MTNIAVLGSGRVGGTLAAKFAETGHQITIGSRNVTEVSARWAGPAVKVASPADAARAASVVVNATPGDTSLERLTALRDELSGKILIDVSNATEHGPDGMPGGLCYPNSSVAEHLQAVLPETRVVKTLNTMVFPVMVDPHRLKSSPNVFLSGDDDAAKKVVTELLGDLGWPAEWIEDLGGITTARGPEAIMLLVPAIMRKHGMVPFAFRVVL